ncbi:ANKRD50 [Mytilus edulis]|uniref:ANKRD50 n=1 Tax=Mytilus edulis TaxID=6550 RepID=A0A8S3QQ34_MYTED|nr:ANKRD50 [Mytilus edulis]
MLSTTNVHKQHISDWIKDDEKFIETKATHQIYEKLKRDSCVLVVALDGNGKSSTVRHIALKLKREEQYEIIPIVLSPFTIFEFLNRNQKQIFIVDDLCGKVNINTQSVDVWVSQIEAILTLLDTSDKNDKICVNDVKLLFATGSNIYDDSIFKKFKLLMKYVFELSNCPLTDDEKLQMMKKYISKETEIRLSHELKSDEAYFPLLCKIAESKTANQIISLFDNLEDFIESDLEHLNNSNNLKFCIITLCALFHNKFKEEILNDVYESEIEKQAFENICLECNLGTNKDQVKSKIKEQLRNLEGMYMTKTENYFHFIHSKVYQIAELVCGKIFLNSFITFVRSAFIAERFSFRLNMTDNNKHTIIITNKDEEKRYFDRLMFDLKQGETYSTFHNSQLSSESYREKFVLYCQSRKQKVRELLKHFSVKSETVGVTCDARDYKDYTEFTKQHHFYSHKMRKPLIESAWEGHADIVKLLLEFDCDINERDKFGRTDLFVACLLGKNEVVNVLLNKDADHSLCDKNKRSPLLVAAREGMNSIVSALLQKMPILIFATIRAIHHY